MNSSCGRTTWRSFLPNARLQKIVPGIALEPWYPELKNAFLTCVTEMNEREEIDRLVRTIAG